MWQPSSNKQNYYGNKLGSYGNSMPPLEDLPANLLHLQKLQLTEMLPPLTVPMSYHSVASLVHNTPTPGLITQLQQNLKSRNRSAIMTPNQWCSNTLNTNTGNSRQRHLLHSSTPQDVSTLSPSPPATFLAPPVLPLPALSIPTGTTCLDMLPLDILADTFIRLNALHLTNSNLTQNLPQHPINVPLNSSPRYYTSSSRSTLSSSPLSLPLSSLPSPNLHSPQHLQLFKQYLSLEQQQLQQIMALSHPLTTTSARAVDNYYNNSINLSTSALSSSSKPLSSSLNSDLNRTSRKRKDDLKDNLRNSNATGSSTTTPSGADDDSDDLNPPPKKKWIRHYLKGII